jgi:hypothetical protein
VVQTTVQVDARFHPRIEQRGNAARRALATRLRYRDASKWFFETLCSGQESEEFDMGSLAKGTVLWLLGVPLSVIILIALFTNYI